MFMKPRSLTLKLLFLVFGGFAATAVGVFFIADIQVKEIVDQSQNAVYEEKLETIIYTLEANVEKLNATGLRESYEEDFQQSALRILRSVYYTEADPRIYPAIISYQGEVVMHPVLSRGDKSLQNTPYIKKIIELKNGDLNYTYITNEEKWCRFKSFEEWEWIVVFVVPLDIKYVDVLLLRNRLILTLAVVIIFVVLEIG